MIIRRSKTGHLMENILTNEFLLRSIFHIHFCLLLYFLYALATAFPPDIIQFLFEVLEHLFFVFSLLLWTNSGMN